jgi:predicted enzyme related to lactoylglutathione lyase
LITEIHPKREECGMRIQLVSVFVDDQEKALRFYTGVLGFIKKQDQIFGEARWLTVVSPEALDGTELVLEPDDNPTAKAYKQGLREQSLPVMVFAVDDIQAEYQRMVAQGALFVQPPSRMGPVSVAVFDDTCGNLIQMLQAE